jgi:hypothetical protein
MGEDGRQARQPGALPGLLEAILAAGDHAAERRRIVDVSVGDVERVRTRRAAGVDRLEDVLVGEASLSASSATVGLRPSPASSSRAARPTARVRSCRPRGRCTSHVGRGSSA